MVAVAFPRKALGGLFLCSWLSYFPVSVTKVVLDRTTSVFRSLPAPLPSGLWGGCP